MTWYVPDEHICYKWWYFGLTIPAYYGTVQFKSSECPRDAASRNYVSHILPTDCCSHGVSGEYSTLHVFLCTILITVCAFCWEHPKICTKLLVSIYAYIYMYLKYVYLPMQLNIVLEVTCTTICSNLLVNVTTTMLSVCGKHLWDSQTDPLGLGSV